VARTLISLLLVGVRQATSAYVGAFVDIKNVGKNVTLNCSDGDPPTVGKNVGMFVNDPPPPPKEECEEVGPLVCCGPIVVGTLVRGSDAPTDGVIVGFLVDGENVDVLEDDSDLVGNAVDGAAGVGPLVCCVCVGVGPLVCDVPAPDGVIV